MSDPIAAMKKMLAALEFLNREGFVLADHEDEMVEAIKAGRAALADPNGEGNCRSCRLMCTTGPECVTLEGHPPTTKKEPASL